MSREWDRFTRTATRPSHSLSGSHTGHGGTLDPLATGVLVIGLGQGTKQLNDYLHGSKRYRAGGEFGFETTTLDLEGNVTKRATFDHITKEQVLEALPQFTGKIQQVPPIFSAIRKDGQKLYKAARKGASADDIEIEPREVEIHSILLTNSSNLPKSFEIDVECGGGTYIRSLVRDIGHKLGSLATTTYLERTQQGPFTLDNSLEKADWSVDSICAAIDRFNQALSDEGDRIDL